MTEKQKKQKIKIAFITIFVTFSLLISYYTYIQLHLDLIITHIFYIPIILAGLWWGRLGILMAVFFIGWIVGLHILLDSSIPHESDILESIMFLVIGTITGELTRMKEKESKKLRETGAHLDSLITHANAPIVVWDKSQKIIRFNKAFENVSGYKKDEVIENGLDVLFPSSSKEETLIKIAGTSRGLILKSVEIPILSKDGDLKIVLWNSSNIYAEDGKSLISTIVHGQDITKRKEAEDKIQSQIEFLRNVAESLTYPFYVIDARDYSIQMANSAACPSGDCLGSTCYELTHHRDTPCRSDDHICPLEEVKTTKKPVVVKHLHYDIDGNERIFEVHGYPIFDDDGNIDKMIEFSLDVTEREEANKALKESEERYSSFVKNFHGIAYKGNLNFIPIFFHGAVEKITGYTSEEFVAGNPSWDKVLHPEDHKKFMAEDSQLQTVKNYSAQREYRIIRKDGETRWVHENIHNVSDESGKPIHVQGAIYDITHRKIAEDKIIKSRDEWKNTFDSISDLISIHDKDFNLIIANKAFIDYTGKSPEELQEKKCYHVLHNSNTPIEGCPQLESSKTGKTTTKERYDDKTGKHFYVSTSPIFNENGEISSYVHYMNDITNIKKAQEKIQEQGDFLTNVFESITYPFYVIDTRDYSIKMANPAVSKSDDWKNLKCYQVTHKTDKPCEGKKHLCPLKEVMRTKKPVVVEHIHFDDYGNMKMFEVHGYPIFNKNGEVTTMIESSIDITERKAAEKSLVEAYEELKSVDRLKSDIISNVSHELKTPLSIIKACLELVQDEEDENEKMELILAGQKAAVRQLDIIDNLIAASQINQKKRYRNLSEIDLNQVIQNSLDKYKDHIIIRNIKINFKPNYDASHIEGEQHAIKLAMDNLVENSIKFNKTGGEIFLGLENDDSNRNVIFTIWDTGVGIEKKYHDKIFEPLTQVDPSTTRYFEGVGMGLYSVKKIVELHGGEITLESELGKGTTFYIRLPILNKRG